MYEDGDGYGSMNDSGNSVYQQAGVYTEPVTQGTEQTHSHQWTQAPERAAVPEKKKGRIFQKVMLSLSLGLLFGIFAGVGFLGVTQASNALQKSLPVANTENNLLPDTGAQKDTLPSTVVKQEDDARVIYTTAQTNVTEIVKDVMPAMVSITNNYTEVTTFWGQRYREDLSASGKGHSGEKTLIEGC